MKDHNMYAHTFAAYCKFNQTSTPYAPPRASPPAAIPHFFHSTCDSRQPPLPAAHQAILQTFHCQVCVYFYYSISWPETALMWQRVLVYGDTDWISQLYCAHIICTL